MCGCRQPLASLGSAGLLLLNGLFNNLGVRPRGAADLSRAVPQRRRHDLARRRSELYSIVSQAVAGVTAKLAALKPEKATGASGHDTKAKIDLRLEKRHWIERPFL